MHPVNFYFINMYALIDIRASKVSFSTLISHGFDLILIPPADYLSEAVASHSDMLFFIGFDRLFCHEIYYKAHKELLDSISKLSSLELSISTESVGEKYPYDVLFNACLIGKRLICNKKTVSKLIIDAAISADCEIIDVPQGYTKCSICPVGVNALITADKAIAKASREHGIDVLLISEGHVSLPPYEYGFIGGASGLYKGKVYFCGSLDTHPDGEKIKKFCTENGAEIIELSNGILQDVGTIFFI